MAPPHTRSMSHLGSRVSKETRAWAPWTFSLEQPMLSCSCDEEGGAATPKHGMPRGTEGDTREQQTQDHQERQITRTHTEAQGNTRIHKGTQRSARGHKRPNEDAREHTETQGYTREHKGKQRSTRGDLREHTGTHGNTRALHF